MAATSRLGSANVYPMRASIAAVASLAALLAAFARSLAFALALLLLRFFLAAFGFALSLAFSLVLPWFLPELISIRSRLWVKNACPVPRLVVHARPTRQPSKDAP